MAVPANTATTVPCEAEGSYLIVSSSVSNVSAGNMTLCDVYPIAAESVPAPAAPSTGSGGSAPAPSTVATPAVAIPPKEGQSPVTVEFDITGERCGLGLLLVGVQVRQRRDWIAGVGVAVMPLKQAQQRVHVCVVEWGWLPGPAAQHP